MTSPLSTRFLRIAVLWFVASVALGAYMGATHQFTDRQIHVHGNLLGWVSCALFALAHHAWPRLGALWTARLHFWLHNLALPVFIVGLGLLMRGQHLAEPLLAVSSLVLVLGAALFAAAVWQVTARQPSP